MHKKAANAYDCTQQDIIGHRIVQRKYQEHCSSHQCICSVIGKSQVMSVETGWVFCQGRWVVFNIKGIGMCSLSGKQGSIHCQGKREVFTIRGRGKYSLSGKEGCVHCLVIKEGWML